MLCERNLKMNTVDYRELLAHFEEQRARRQQEFKMEMEGLEETISGLKKMLGNQQSTLFRPQPQIVTNQREGRYAGISVRWAILNLLGEDAVGPLPTSKIAEALTTGGITSTSQNFTSNVSAVVSDMTNKRRELESTDGGYRLTDNGRAAWDAIKRTPQYLNRSIAIAS
jgi:hypothetical protein